MLYGGKIFQNHEYRKLSLTLPLYLRKPPFVNYSLFQPLFHISSAYNEEGNNKKYDRINKPDQSKTHGHYEEKPVPVKWLFTYKEGQYYSNQN
jgi:hypothetical protein